ncbi:MAG TPA: leucyl aminopeptidase [Stellaceae bacterium]|jgi:leucyl aminopeptidase|nr:leucyl aminopeptidase [Stellaceae bacterium]
MKIAFAEPGRPKSGTIVVGVLEDRKLTPTAAALDKETGGALQRAIAASRFTGRKDEVLGVLAPPQLAVGRVMLLGLGKAAALDEAAMQGLGGNIVAQLNGVGESEAAVMLDRVEGMKPKPAEAAAHLAFGATLRAYRFDRYRTKEKPDQKPSLKTLTVMSREAAAARRAFAPLKEVAEGVFLTRDLVSEPANVIYPETLAAAARQLGKLGVAVEVLDERQMKKLGMNALLGVGQGSVRPPRLVVMQWKGGGRGKAAQPVAFIGKGVTFDTGGISIKPADGMWDMKWDMGGAGVVIGLMRALAGRKARVNAVGVIGLVENMPSGAAQRPGDIVASMSGQTIEVLNTDAEGRLVLADALWYCQDRFKPKFMVDLATLTGAIIIALGSEHAGLFSNNDELASRLAEAGAGVGEKIWRLPLNDAYDRMMDSDAADIKNISGGRDASSITAAQFLQRFVNGVPWAHLDIAGTTWSKKDAATVPKGATAFGVRLLDRLVAEHYEG